MCFSFLPVVVLFTSSCILNSSQVVVGTAHGRMGCFDLRMNKPEHPVRIFKSFAGAVRDIVVHPHLPLVFSVALDRFLRVHHLETGKLIHKVVLHWVYARLWSWLITSYHLQHSSYTLYLLQEYLKSRLNCVLVRDDFEEGDLLPTRGKPKRKWMERKMEMEEEMGYDSSEESCEKVRKIEDDEVW